jgi:hypothetical protein
MPEKLHLTSKTLLLFFFSFFPHLPNKWVVLKALDGGGFAGESRFAPKVLKESEVGKIEAQLFVGHRVMIIIDDY